MNRSCKTWGHAIWLRRAILLLPVLGLFLLATACDTFFVSESSVQSISATPATGLLHLGDAQPNSIKITATATTVGKSTPDITDTAVWHSTNTDAATVSQGVVTAGAIAGSTVVTAKDSSSGVTSNNVNIVTYSVTTPQNLVVTADRITAGGTAVAGTYQFRAFLGPGSTNEVTQFVAWSSDPTTIATVSSTTAGLVTTVTPTIPTTVTITATGNVGSSTGTATTITGSLQFTAR